MSSLVVFLFLRIMCGFRVEVVVSGVFWRLRGSSLFTGVFGFSVVSYFGWKTVFGGG